MRREEKRKEGQKERLVQSVTNKPLSLLQFEIEPIHFVLVQILRLRSTYCHFHFSEMCSFVVTFETLSSGGAVFSNSSSVIIATSFSLGRYSTNVNVMNIMDNEMKQ